MVEFFEAHPGPHLLTCQDLASELRTCRCRLHYPPPDLGRCCFIGLAEPAHGHPIHARFDPATDLHFHAGAGKRPGGWPAARFEAC